MLGFLERTHKKAEAKDAYDMVYQTWITGFLTGFAAGKAVQDVNDKTIDDIYERAKYECRRPNSEDLHFGVVVYVAMLDLNHLPRP